MIPYGRQSIDESDVAAVAEVLRGDWLTQGPAVEAFETAVATRVGARHAVAFSSGTAALHGAVAAAGIGSGDLVAVPSLTFVASANCARYVGADVVLVDIEEATLCLDPATVPPEATALVAVHFAGRPMDLARLAHRPRVVIEDAAHALGAVGPDGPVGNCARSDLCVFSFHPVKSIAAGEGGMVTTNSEELAGRLRRFRHHGIRPGDADRPWRYDIDELAYNFRLSDLHAALGSSQLRRLDEFVARRNALAARYDDLLADAAVVLPPGVPEGWVHARHLYPVRVDGRDALYHRLRAAGIGVQVHYVPIHRLTAYGAGAASLSATDAAADRLLSLPMYADLTVEDQDRVVDAVDEALRSR